MTVTLASIALSLLAQAVPAEPAMSPAAPVSVTISAGGGRTWEDEGSIGRGTSAAGGVEWRFRPKWSVGGEVERLGHQRDTPGLQWSGRTIFASMNIAYRFAERGPAPYVGGGFGGAFYKGEVIDRFSTPSRTIPRSSTSTMGYGTAGLEIPVGDRLAVSPEVRITMCRPPDDFAPWSAIRFGVKAAVRF